MIRTATTEQPTDNPIPGWILLPDGDGYKMVQEPAFDVVVTGKGEHDLDDISVTVYAGGEVSDTAKQDQQVVISLYNTGTSDRTLSYTVKETERGNIFDSGNIELAAGAENTDIEFMMIYADVTVTITDNTADGTASLHSSAADTASLAANRRKAASAVRKEAVSEEDEEDAQPDLSEAETKREKRSSRPATPSDYED